MNTVHSSTREVSASPAFRKGRQAEAQFRRRGDKAANPYNGPELRAEWEAGFAAGASWCIRSGQIVRGANSHQRVTCPSCGRLVTLRMPLSGGWAAGAQMPRHYEKGRGSK